MKDRVGSTVYWVPRILILVFSILVFGFALLSGAENYGGGLKGVLMNSPNSVPWLILMGAALIAWKWEKIGGWILIAISVLFAFFFNAWEDLGAFLILIMPISIAGILFLLGSRLRQS